MESRTPVMRIDAPFISRSDGQTFFIGPALFLRPVEPDDAATAPLWYPSFLPAPVEVARERIERQLGDDPFAEMHTQRLLICRRSDDRPLGSVLFLTENERTCRLLFTHDPNRSLDERAATEAEIMRCTLPFLIEKRNLMKATTDHLGDHPLVEAAAAELGMRRCYRLREAYRVGHRRYDRIGYELLNPVWVRLLGMPRAMTEEPAEREIRNPAAGLTAGGEPAPQSIVAGKRLELRAFEPSDGAAVTSHELRETEDFYPQGPPLRNPFSYGQHMAAVTRQVPPNQVRLAIVESASETVLGMIGAAQIDSVHGTAKTTVEIFRPEFRGQGYGAEAGRLLQAWLFERIGLHMVYAWVSEFNPRSLAATRKRGYREAGYFAWEDLSPEGFTGGFYLDLLASEWWRAQR